MRNGAANLTRVPNFDDIVFEIRNREYGAYVLRRNYKRNVTISLIVAVTIMTMGVVFPFLKAKALDRSQHKERLPENIVSVILEQPAEQLAPPPVAPPPAETVQPAKYIPPVVVDSVKPEDEAMLMTADEASIEVQNTEVVDTPVEIKEEVKDEVDEELPFTVVEEMPMFPGGDAELMKYIGEHLVYPPIAQENNIQGRVTVKFCVNTKGGTSQISVMKGVDPELDKEAIRVVSTLPAFKPGKQGGKAVPVWYTVPIIFKLVTN
jgi:protein TonB